MPELPQDAGDPADSTGASDSAGELDTDTDTESAQEASTCIQQVAAVEGLLRELWLHPAEDVRSAAAPLRRVVDVIEVPDRREAIIRAVRLARASGAPHPVVLVAGKGHEQGQEVAGVVHPFDDRSVVRQALLDELSPARPGGQ